MIQFLKINHLTFVLEIYLLLPQEKKSILGIFVKHVNDCNAVLWYRKKNLKTQIIVQKVILREVSFK